MLEISRELKFPLPESTERQKKFLNFVEKPET